MNLTPEVKKYIPYDKSWIIRMGVLDLINGYDDAIIFLEKNKNELSDDLQSLHRASLQWKSGGPIDVGESGTLYRFLRFASWKLGLDKKFVRRGTLEKREICDDPDIVNWPLEKLLTLDNGTSQWASASVLLGDKDVLFEHPHKLNLTYHALKYWRFIRKNKGMWAPKEDGTMRTQALAYLQWLKEGKMNVFPSHSEDYCFARAFGLMTAEQGEQKWPSLKGHESNRITEMEEALKQKEITSQDHRVVQAIAMLRKSKEGILHPKCVSKSWPQFWKFMEYSLNRN